MLKTINYKKVVLTIISLSLNINCSPSHIVGSGSQTTSSTNQSSSNLIGTPLEASSIAIYEKTAFPILRTNCASCHGTTQAPLHSVANVSDSHTTVLSYSLANLTVPSSSRLVVKIKSGHNGFPVSIANSLEAAIADWAAQVAAISGGALPTVPVIPLEPTYTSINTLILQPKCVSCHGAIVARSGVRYDTYTNTLLTVTAGNPSASKLHQAITASGGDRMPANAPALSTEEIDVITQWILNGAAQ